MGIEKYRFAIVISLTLNALVLARIQYQDFKVRKLLKRLKDDQQKMMDDAKRFEEEVAHFAGMIRGSEAALEAIFDKIIGPPLEEDKNE